MIFFKHLSVPLALLLSSIGLTSGNAYAVDNIPDPKDPFAGVSCLTSQNSICVQEIDFLEGGGQYQITNNSGQEIFMFGVTNSEAVKAFSTESKIDGSYKSFWQGQTISKTDWNDTQYEQFGAFKAASGGGAGKEMYRLTSKLGTFESLFGTEDSSVNIYWHIQGSDFDKFTSGTLNQFYWEEAKKASQVTVFDINGVILSTSVAAVPEPETYAMFMAGLGLLGFASRRKKS